jgi:hypothetical protein
MSVTIDPVNELTYGAITPKSQVNNVGQFLLDRKDFHGRINVRVDIGTKTVGDNDGNIALRVLHSNTNNISNAVNYGSTTVGVTNNNTTSGSIPVDSRDSYRYLFIGVGLSGTNSPAYPISAIAIGQAQIEP